MSLLPPIDGPGAFAGQFPISRETLSRLETYVSLLRRWQKAVNLVGPGTLPDLWHRHVADSAQLAPLLPPGARTLVDVGSGAGFPGLVLAIVLGERGEKSPAVTLIESDGRRAAFLREVARQTGVAVDILGMRIEKYATQSRQKGVDVVTARALAPLPRLLDLTAPLFGPETIGLFLKGRDVEAEVGEARKAFSFKVALLPSLTHAEGRIVRLEHLCRRGRGPVAYRPPVDP